MHAVTTKKTIPIEITLMNIFHSNIIYITIHMLEKLANLTKQ